MKILKNIYVCMIIACSALTFWAVSTKQTEQSDFQIKNVEALANEEGQNKYICVGEGEETCPITGKKVRIVFTLSR